MFTVLLSLAFLVAILTFPIMFAARLVGAEKTGFGSALLSVFLLTVLSTAVSHMISNQFLSFLIGAAGGALVFSMTLGTTFWKGLAVSIIFNVLVFICLLVLAGVLIGAGVGK